MNSEQLRYFIIAAKHLNFSAAAKELYITQPAISHQIVTLEQELGTTLFHRSTRKITLTRAGETFLEDAKRLLDIEANAKERVNKVMDDSDLSLRIAYLLAPTQSFLPKLLSKFHEEYPQVDIQLTRMDARILAEALPLEDQDLYFSLIKDFDTRALTYMQIFVDQFCLICAPDHPIAQASTLDFNKLASETFLMINPKIGPYMAKEIQEICHEMHFQPRSIRYLDSMEEILFTIDAGMGVTILPSKNQALYPSSLVYLPLEGTHCLAHFGVAWSANHTNPAISWFLELLTQSLSLHPEWF